MIYTVTLNPALDKTAVVQELRLDTVNRITQLRTDPGGKGINVSKMLAGWGIPSVALAILGGAAGRQIEQALCRQGITVWSEAAVGDTRTNLKVIDPVQGTHTDINEPGPAVSAEALERLLERLSDALRPGDIVVLSGSLPNGAPADTYRTWGEGVKAAGAKVFLDADGPALAQGLKAAPWLVKPNDAELSRLVGRALSEPEELAHAGCGLLETGVRQVVVSMGGRGALFLADGRALYAPALQVPVGSTVGAGDSVVAALAAACAQNLDEGQTIRLAMATGAAAVQCSGTQAPDPDAIRRLIPQVVFRALDL